MSNLEQAMSRLAGNAAPIDKPSVVTATTDNAANVTTTTKPTPYTTGLAVNEALEKLGEKLGEFKEYSNQLTIPEITGTRVVKLLYQVNKATGKKLRENSYVRIPVKHLSEEHIVSRVAELAPFVLTWLQELEDKEIKLGHSRGLLSLHTEGLSLDKIIEKLEESNAGARLNKEKIAAWFNAEMQEMLVVLIADKMGISDTPSVEQLAKLEQIVAAYREKYESLAGGKTNLGKEDCLAMIDVIKKCEADGTMLGSRFIVKLQIMSEKDKEILFSL